MSVSLSIEREGAPLEILPLAGQATAERLASIGQSMGMKHVPYFYSFYPIEPEYLDEVIEELKALHEAIRSQGEGWQGEMRSIDRIVAALTELKGQTGWKASFG